MVDINKSLQWFDARHRSKPNAPKYSMKYPARLGPNYLDCSSAVYYALKAAGWKSSINYIGTTETLFKEKNFKEIYNYNDVQPGDIFVRGGEGSSAGAGGHTGMFYKKNGIVHMNYSNNGISYNDLNSYLTYYIDRRRSWKERYFRPIDSAGTASRTNSGAYKIKNEIYFGIAQNTVNIRTAPSTSAKIVGQYRPLQSIYYDQVWYGDGYRWLSYPTSNGRMYVAYRPENNKYKNFIKIS